MGNSAILRVPCHSMRAASSKSTNQRPPAECGRAGVALSMSEKRYARRVKASAREVLTRISSARLCRRSEPDSVLASYSGPLAWPMRRLAINHGKPKNTRRSEPQMTIVKLLESLLENILGGLMLRPAQIVAMGLCPVMDRATRVDSAGWCFSGGGRRGGTRRCG
jgi:hypothetical protein